MKDKSEFVEAFQEHIVGDDDFVPLLSLCDISPCGGIFLGVPLK